MRRERIRSKYSGLNFVKSNLGCPSSATPGPVRRWGSGSNRIFSSVQGTKAASQCQKRMKLWLCFTIMSMYAG